jgi:hypothetical protein
MTTPGTLGFDPAFPFTFCLYAGVLLAIGLAVLAGIRYLRKSAQIASQSAATQQELTHLLAESVTLQKENNALLRTLLDRQSKI